MRAPLLLIAASVALTAGCRTNLPIIPVEREKPHDTRYVEAASGMRFVFEEDHDLPRVAIRMTVLAGSADEPRGKEGLARLCAYLFFRTRNDPKFTTLERLDYLGGANTHGRTHQDRSVFETMVPASALASTLSVLGEAVEHPLQGVDQATLEVQRRIAIDAFVVHVEANGIGAAHDALDTQLFPTEHPYGRATTVASLSAITWDDVERFYREHYLPKQLVFTLVGNFDSRQLARVFAESLPESLFEARGDPTDSPRLPIALPDPPPRSGLVTVDAEVDQPELYLGITVPGPADPHTPFKPLPLESFLASAITNGPPRLQGQLLRSWVGQTVSLEGTILWARLVLQENADPTAVFNQVADAMVAQVMAQPDARVGWMLRDEGQPPDPDQTLLERADELATAAFLTQAHLAARSDLTLPMVVAKRYLTRDRIRGVVVRPGVPAPTARPATEGRSPRARISQTPVSFPKAEAAALARSEDLSRTRTFTTDNGVTVTLVPQPHASRLRLLAGFAGGTQDLPPRGAYAWLKLAGKRLHNGTVDHTHDHVFVIEDATLVSFATHLADLDTFVDHTLSELNALKVTWEDDNEPLRSALNRLQIDEARPAQRASAAFTRALFRGDPFGKPITAAELRAQPKGVTAPWLDRVITPHGAHLVISGPFDPAAEEAVVREVVSRWKPRANAEPVPPLEVPDGNGRQQLAVIDVPGQSWVSMRLGCRVDGGDHAEVSEVLTEALRLEFDDALRDERGESDGVNSTLNFRRGNASFLVLDARLDTALLDDALKTFFGELRRRGESLWDDRTVDRARWFVAKQSGGQLPSEVDNLVQLALGGVRGFSPERLSRLGERLAAVTPGQVDRAWERCQRTLIVELSGNAEQIKKSLETARQK